ncbi:MAG: acyl-CoA transferase [Enterovirga sp.]|nr:acyl-CoA transferase [Enterovirga sp.]
MERVGGGTAPQQALAGVRVIDAATLGAAPLAAALMAEFGADVIKVEHPKRGDPLRDWGGKRNGIGLLWKSIGRNKRSITLDLHFPEGQDLLRELVKEADVLIVNFRPGRLEKWGLAWEHLHAINPKLIMLQITGFGYTGPYASRPGFGTLGEAMSGFAHTTGPADGPPTLPPFMLADGVASLNAVNAVMFALYHRDVHGADGQFIDLNLIEPLMRLLEHMYLEHDQLGVNASRNGNRWNVSVPRNTYKTSDGKWIATSGSSPTVAARIFKAIGREELASHPEFGDAQGRLRRADEIDGMVAEWVLRHPQAEVLRVLEEAEVAVAPVYDIATLMSDPHIVAREAFLTIDDPELGPMRVQAPAARLSETQGRVKHLGPVLGSSNDEIYSGLLGLSEDRMNTLKSKGVI